MDNLGHGHQTKIKSNFLHHACLECEDPVVLSQVLDKQYKSVSCAFVTIPNCLCLASVRMGGRSLPPATSRARVV